MKKILSGIALTAMFAIPLLASAATISNPLFSNGQTSIDATGGSTVSGTFTLTVGSGEVVEWLRTQSDPSQPFTDTSVGGTLGDQEQVYTNVPFSVKVPPNTGTYYPTVQGAGTFGGNRSINGGDNVVLGSTGLGTVRVVANDSTGGSFDISDQNAFMAWFMTHFGNSTTTASAPAPTVDPKCTEIAPFLGATPYAYSSQGVQLQSALLLDNPFSIPALHAGSTIQMGYFGTQTHAALAAFNATHKCN